MPLLDSFDGFIFDYGGVLVFHQTKEERDSMAAIAKISPEKFEQLYWRNRNEYDRGVTSAADYWQEIARNAGTSFSANQIEELVEGDIASWTNFDETMWEFVAQLKAAGKRTAILSNIPQALGEGIQSRFNRFQRFDFLTLSYQIKSIKPEPAIYEHCLEGLGTAARRTIFFDDKIANVRGAEALGITGVEFLDRDEVLERMSA